MFDIELEVYNEIYKMMDPIYKMTISKHQANNRMAPLIMFSPKINFDHFQMAKINFSHDKMIKSGGNQNSLLIIFWG